MACWRPTMLGISTVLAHRNLPCFRSVVCDYHLTASLPSRIKWRATHAPFFFTKKTNKQADEPLTASNRAFLDRALRQSYDKDSHSDRYAYVRPSVEESPGDTASPLKPDLIPWPRGSWEEETERTTRVGLIGRKIGVVPLWYKNGKKVMATMIHIEDNHVVRYIPREDFARTVVAERRHQPNLHGVTPSISRDSLVVGALSADPAAFTKDYCGLFTGSGVMPKKMLARFPVSSNALIQPGTPLYASHFQVDQYVDVHARTYRRGFQGVMKRWGFAGMPKASGVTKSHRRPGSIGSGCGKDRVWPGQKMPGHVGGHFRKMLGLRVLRINHKHNVLYIMGQAIPGEPGEFVKVYDCKIKEKSFCDKSPRFFPTCYPEDYDNLTVEEEYANGIHRFEDPTLMYKKD